ncbi:threonine synthase [Ekhidna sp.]
MEFYSTKDRTNTASFREAVLNSLPGDTGLYFPTEIPKLQKEFLNTLGDKRLPDIALEVLKHFCKKDVPEDKLISILQDTFTFDIPLTQVGENTHCLELFHGPTMAFKDVGARFLARVMGFFKESENSETTILVATSGDTGGAVASGFYNQPGINVVILYPQSKVTALQEHQMTTLGGNIQAIKVNGDFDDCQALVKQAFLDKHLSSQMNLSSANSINIARWLPQSVYYYVPYINMGLEEQLVFSVPSGNYGNITSGILAKKMGLPIHRFIAASNANDVVPRYLIEGEYRPKETVPTISNAMDVSMPSNFTRLQTLYDNDIAAIRRDITGFSMDDEETKLAIKKCFERNEYIMDPHSAIGYQALQDSLKEGEKGVFLGTAHYCKFLPTMNDTLGTELSIPDVAQPLLEKEKIFIEMETNYEQFKEFLVS